MTEGRNQAIENLKLDASNLYREIPITDLKVGTIRRLMPVKPDGSDDPDRPVRFVGNTQLMTPSGLLPIQCELDAASFEEAMDQFPEAVVVEAEEMLKNQNETQQS